MCPSAKRRGTRWTAEESGFDSQQGQGITFSCTVAGLAPVFARSLVHLKQGALSLKVERSEREADYSAMLRMHGARPPLPIRLQDMMLI
jgi:hypothetical protein